MYSLDINLNYKYVCCNVAYYSYVVLKLLDTVIKQQQFSEKLRTEKLCPSFSFKMKIKCTN